MNAFESCTFQTFPAKNNYTCNFEVSRAEDAQPAKHDVVARVKAFFSTTFNENTNSVLVACQENGMSRGVYAILVPSPSETMVWILLCVWEGLSGGFKAGVTLKTCNQLDVHAIQPVG